MNKKVAAIVCAALFLLGLSAVIYIRVHKQGESSTHRKTAAVYICPMHAQIIRNEPGECPICGMNLVLKAEEKSGPEHTAETAEDAPTVFVDAAVVQKMGVTTDTVRVARIRKKLHLAGIVKEDETRLSVVTVKTAGWIEKLYVDFTGRSVSQGQPLLELYSPELVSAQEEYLQAFRAVKASSGAGSGLLESSRERLMNWDIGETALRDLEARGKAQKTMPLVSPVNGVVIEKPVKTGDRVEPGMTLYRIADLSVVWVVASVYPMDLGFVRLGQEAEITFAYLPGKRFKGKVAFISPVLDSVTRTLPVRVEARNTPDFELKANMFADVDISAQSPDSLAVVPEQAVIRSGVRNVVVLSVGDGYFKPVEIVLGASGGGLVQVVSGLKGGESIVTSSQFLIDSESNLKTAIAKLTGGASSGSSGSGQKQIFICPMHPQVMSDKPGSCSICGMDLVEKR